MVLWSQARVNFIVFEITILSFLTIVAFLVVFGYLYLYVLPKGPELTTPKPLEIGKGNFVMSSYKHTERKSIRVWTYKPDSWEPDNTVRTSGGLFQTTVCSTIFLSSL